MSLTYTVAVQNARAQALTNLIDASATAGSITIYTGTPPAAVGTITDQVALITIPLQKPCYSSITSGVITLAAITEQMLLQTGQAGWARLKNGDGLAIADMTVGINGSGADIELPTVDLIQGAYIRITAGQITEG